MFFGKVFDLWRKLWRVTVNSLNWPIVPSFELGSGFRRALGVGMVLSPVVTTSDSSHSYFHCAFHFFHQEVESNYFLCLGSELAVWLAVASWMRQCCVSSRLSHGEAWQLLFLLPWANHPAEGRGQPASSSSATTENPNTQVKLSWSL